MPTYVTQDVAPISLKPQITAVVFEGAVTADNTAGGKTLGTLIGGVGIPHWEANQTTDGGIVYDYPKAVYLWYEGTDEVRFTLHGVAPVTGASYVGMKLTTNPVRIPFPQGFTGDTIKLICSAATGRVGYLFER